MRSVLWGGGFGSIIVVYDGCGISQTNYMYYFIKLSPEVAVNNPFSNILFHKIGRGRKSSSLNTRLLLYDVDGKHDRISYP